MHGESVSAWVDRAARQALGVEDGLAAMDDYELEFGTFTAEELAEADRMIAEDVEAQRNRSPRASR